MADDEQNFGLGFKLPKNVKHDGLRFLIHSVEGFIQNQEFRFLGKGAG